MSFHHIVGNEALRYGDRRHATGVTRLAPSRRRGLREPISWRTVAIVAITAIVLIVLLARS